MMSRLLFLFFSIFVFVAPQIAHARIDIIPHILVLEGRERSAEIIALNLEGRPTKFDVSIIHYRQDEQGVYTTLDAPLSDLFNTDEIVRMLPTSFELPEQGRQKIRIALRKPSDLPDGEYRFHVVTKSSEGSEKPEDEETGGGPSARVNVNFGIAIPVIVRHGDLSATGKLQDFNLRGPSETESGKAELSFTATREGNRSTLGLVEVFWAPSGQDFEKIGFITNFNLFTEINRREGLIALDKVPAGKGRLRILYTDTKTEEVYDEIILNQ